jgi:hypothetical protein
MKHVKPTPEELEQNAQNALEEAEKLKEPKESEEVEEVEEQKEQKDEEVEVEEVEEKEPEEPEKPKEPEKTQKPQEDYKKKFIESTKESQVLYAKNKKYSEVFDNIEKIEAPTEDELKKEFPDWEVMSDFEKKIATDNVVNNRKLAEISKIAKESKDIEKWQGDVETFITNPESLNKYPGLEGKEDEFKVFAIKPTRRGVDFEDLVASFLFNESQSNVKHKGKMFENGNGGPKEPPKVKSDKIGIEESMLLKKTDYKKWTEMLKAGKINNEIVDKK